jgi:predicted transcriptional regulator
MQDDRDLRVLLWSLIGATRGGETRAKLIHELRTRPGNLNQLAARLGVEYRTVKHHIEALKKNSLVEGKGEHYGMTYFLNPWLEAHISVFDEICSKLKLKFESSS